MWGFIITVAVVAIVIAVIGTWAYNSMVRRRNRTNEAWSQIEVELERRHDLIPNLVETVKGYATHERGTFDAVTQARSAAIAAGATRDPNQISVAENALGSTLRSLFAVAEAYPSLRASENFLALQEELTATEDKLEYARRYYNTSTRDYNTVIQTFPRVVLARPFGFVALGYFLADNEAKQVPRVDFTSATATPTE
jgi:LemA protein